MDLTRLLVELTNEYQHFAAGWLQGSGPPGHHRRLDPASQCVTIAYDRTRLPNL
jgi:hypothetical protein